MTASTSSTPSRPLSSIMDGNSFRAADEEALPDRQRSLIRRRRDVLGAAYRLFYRRPVTADTGTGCWISDDDGARFLDAYNNVPSIGHGHPGVADAVAHQLRRINTHTRYLNDGIVEYSEKLLATFPDHLDNVMFTNSGSEANDLALQIAQAVTGGTGIVVTSEAYHGTTALLATISPAGNRQEHAHVRIVETPDTLRIPADRIATWFADQVRAAFADLRAAGITPAAFIADPIFSSDGIYPGEPGYLASAIDVVHDEGALFISDEVQPGFGRTGEAMWGFQRHGVGADLVTIGKPMGNGIPVAAVVGRRALMDAFAKDVAYFNTFGGNPASIAAARVVLDTVTAPGFIDAIAETGEIILAALREIATRYDEVGDVRGAGLYIGVEIVDADGAPDGARAKEIVNEMRERNVLISVAGHHSNVLKIRPPLVFGAAEARILIAALDDTFARRAVVGAF